MNRIDLFPVNAVCVAWRRPAARIPALEADAYSFDNLMPPREPRAA